MWTKLGLFQALTVLASLRSSVRWRLSMMADSLTKNLQISSLTSTGASLTWSEHQPPTNHLTHIEHRHYNHELIFLPVLGTSPMPWPSWSTRLKGMNNSTHTITPIQYSHCHNRLVIILCRLGLSLTMDESLEEVQVCANPEAAMSRRLTAIRWTLSLISVMHLWSSTSP